MKIKCPHNEETEQRKELGIYFYYHVSDNSLCNLLNSSSLSLNRLHKETLEHKQYDLNHIYVKASMRQPIIINYFADKIAELSLDDLKIIFKEYHDKRLLKTQVIEKLVKQYKRETYLIFKVAEILGCSFYDENSCMSGYPYKEVLGKEYGINLGDFNQDEILTSTKIKAFTGKQVKELLGIETASQEDSDTKPEELPF